MSRSDEEKHAVVLDEQLQDSNHEDTGSLTIKFEEERRLIRKLDRRILPIACLLYLLAFLDRSNLGNARLQGLPHDALGGDPTGNLYNWVNSAFYFTYVLCQVPATVLSKLFPPSYWMAGAAIGWGLSSTLMSVGFNFGGLVAARLFLGVFEAGFGPAIPVYFSLFYTKAEMGLRMAYWFGFAAVAGAFGGLIAFGVQHAHSAVAHWKILFIIEGLPAILMGVICMFFLPDRPESTRFLTEAERRVAIERMNRHSSGDVGAVINKKHVFMALTDWRVYTGGAIYFGVNCALASIGAFLPSIITTFGYSNALAQLLTVPPYAVSAIVLTLTSYASDRVQSRGLFVAAACGVGSLGYLLLIVGHGNNHVRYFAVFCITSGTYTAIGVIIAWFSHNLGSESKRAAGIPLFMAIGQCGSVLGTHLYPTNQAPRYIEGFAVCAGLELFAMFCALVLYASYKWDNAHRNGVHGPSYPPVDTSEYADKASNFRYLT